MVLPKTDTPGVDIPKPIYAGVPAAPATSVVSATGIPDEYGIIAPLPSTPDAPVAPVAPVSPISPVAPVGPVAPSAEYPADAPSMSHSPDVGSMVIIGIPPVAPVTAV
jgi:hypothetical protein